MGRVSRMPNCSCLLYFSCFKGIETSRGEWYYRVRAKFAKQITRKRYKQDKLLLRATKKPKKRRYKQALGLLDFIEAECNNKIDYFSRLSTVNKERSIIFRKLKEMEACKYYNALSYINILQHQAYRFEADIWEPNQTLDAPFKEDSINKAIADYMTWFYPILVEFRKIRSKFDAKLSDWDFLLNGGKEEHLYETNSRLDELIKNIDETPFYIFYRKYNVLSIPNIAIKYKDTKPYVPDLSVSNTKPNVTFKITIWTVLKVLVKSSFSKNKTSR